MKLLFSIMKELGGYQGQQSEEKGEKLVTEHKNWL